MPLRLLLVTRAHNPNAGGMERLSFELAAALQKNSEIDTNIIFHRGSRATSPLFVILSLPRVLWQSRRADVVHFGDPLLSASAWFVKKLIGVPIAVTVHGLDITYQSTLYQFYLRLFFPVFDRYIAISQHVGKLLEKKNISSSKISVITPAVTNFYFDPTISREKLSEVLKTPVANSIVLLTVGRLVERKGHAWFIEQALPALPENVMYVIAGTGPEKSRIHQTAEKSNVAERVRMLDRVSNEDLKILYNTVDAFIQPNIAIPNDPEGFGLVLLEAALCQRPVFAANIDGIPDAVHDHKNGTLLPAQNVAAWQQALRSFCSQPEAALSARSYTLQTFRWEDTAVRYLATFEQTAI